MLSLTIHHNIHLNREQRYALHAGTEIVTVGVSVPVWHLNKITSEPAKEMFCKYYLKNPHQELPIKIVADGYEIVIPYRAGVKLEISNEEWQELRQNNPAKLNELQKKCVREISSKRLLDLSDGGSAYLSYKELNTVALQNSQQKPISIMHHVIFNTYEGLIESLN